MFNMTNPRLIFITGSSGVGKSTIVPILKAFLPANFDVHDFDERLTKEIAMNSELVDTWRLETTSYWIDLARKNAKEGKSTVVVGLVYPKEVSALNPSIPTYFYLLDASDEVIRERLMGKRFSTSEKVAGLYQATGRTPEKFIEENKSFMDKLREEISSTGGEIVDTTHDLPEETARKLIDKILS